MEDKTQGPWNPWMAWYELERAVSPYRVLMRHGGDTWIVQVEETVGNAVVHADNAPTPTEAITLVLSHVQRNKR